MNAAQKIHQALSTDSAITQSVNHIRPIKLNPQDVFPAIRYQITSTEPTTSLGGDTARLDHVRVQIDVFADAYETVQTISNLIRQRMRQKIALVNKPQTQTDYLIANFGDQDSSFDDDSKRYRVRQEYWLWS